MNTFGRIFRVMTYGESHGFAVGGIVDGCPSGLELTTEDVQMELDRRRPGKSSIETERKELDRVEILSGIFEGKTLGTPISMLVRNLDVDSSKYEKLRDIPRPGHADFMWREKFGRVDFRGGGRSGGRETVSRVAAGAIAKKLIGKFGMEVIAYSMEIAGIRAEGIKIDDIPRCRRIIDSSPVKTLNPKKGAEMENAILKAKEDKDSVGGIIDAVALGVPSGLGEPVFDKLDADLAKALMSIPSVKGVEVGMGFKLAGMKGSEANDPFVIENGRIKTRTNNCGGILGGISNGMPIVVRIAVKPTSSIGKEQSSVDVGKMRETTIKIEGRHDPCIVPRAVPIVEAMVSLVLADHSLISGAIPRKIP